MPKTPKTIPVTELREDAVSVLDEIQKVDEPWIITHRGRAAAVLLNLEAYERALKEKEILRLLATGEKELDARRGHWPDDVFRDADKLLSAGQS